jgi:hypothetical protein
METQNITPDKNGHYTVVLGSTMAQGLPTDLFASGEDFNTPGIQSERELHWNSQKMPRPVSFQGSA